MPKLPGATAPPTKPVAKATPRKRVPPAAELAGRVAESRAKNLAALAAVPDTGDLLDSALPLEQVEDYTRTLYYGPHGTGKTTDIAAMANLGTGEQRVILINAEGGLKRRPLANLGIDVARILVLPNPKLGQMLTFEYLEQLFWDSKLRLEQRPGSILGFGWDSITEIVKKLLENEVERQVTKAEMAGRDRERFFIDRSDYGTMAEQVRLLVRRFRDLPCHLGITALERRDVDDDGQVVYNPAVTPALQNDLMGYMDIVCHTEVAEVGGVDEYRGLTRPVGKYRGKDRFGVLPKKLVDPRFDRIHQYVVEQLDLDSDPVMQTARQRRADQARTELAEAQEQPSDDQGDN